MTPREADKLIKTGKLTIVKNNFYNETFEAIFVNRDRYNIISRDGGVYDREELEIVG